MFRQHPPSLSPCPAAYLWCEPPVCSPPEISGLSSTWSKRPGLKRRVQHIRAVGGRDNDHVRVGIETVHLNKIWFRVCSRSSWLPPAPALSGAQRRRSRLRRRCRGVALGLVEQVTDPGSPTPTNISTNSEPLLRKNGTPASGNRPRRRLTGPWGSHKQHPFGIFAPRAANFSGYFKTLRLRPAQPWPLDSATSLNVIVGLLPTIIRALLLPKSAWLLLPWAWRIMNNRIAPKKMSGRKLARRTFI